MFNGAVLDNGGRCEVVDKVRQPVACVGRLTVPNHLFLPLFLIVTEPHPPHDHTHQGKKEYGSYTPKAGCNGYVRCGSGGCGRGGVTVVTWHISRTTTVTYWGCGRAYCGCGSLRTSHYVCWKELYLLDGL